MLDLVLSFVIALILSLILLWRKVPKKAVFPLVLLLGGLLAWFFPFGLGLNATVYSDLLSVGQLNFLYNQSNGDILTAIQLANQLSPYMTYIVIGANLVVVSFGFLIAYAVIKIARHDRSKRK